MRTRSIGLATFLLLLATPAGAHGEIQVTNTNDSGGGSLRQAILAAAADAGTAIEFAIPGEGVQTITLASPLPAIGTGTSIDGTTQPGASCTTWPPTLLIEIDGTNLMPGEDALTVVGSTVTIRSLVVNRAPGDGIRVDAASGFGLTCSYIGTDASGTLDLGNGETGLHLDGAVAAQIGGPLPTDRNLISGNAIGIVIAPLASDNVVEGNYIGSSAAGLTAIGNGNAIQLDGSNNDVGPGNVISGNTISGVVLAANSAVGNQIDGNRIGVGAAGGALSNGGAGVDLSAGASSNGIGTIALGNVIQNNAGVGVVVLGSQTVGNSIRGNQLTNNGTNGINLVGAAFEDLNDPGDPDSGPNRIQNTPVLGAVSLTVASATLHADFTVDSAPANASYPLAVDFYKTGADEEEGALYLGTASYSEADFAMGTVTRDFVAAGAVDVGDLVVATATDAAGNTSEYSDLPATVELPEPGVTAAALASVLALARMKRLRAAR